MSTMERVANDSAPARCWLEGVVDKRFVDPAGRNARRPTTAVVLVTDLVASTRHRCRLGEELADELSERHGRLIAEVIGACGGWLVKGTGDGALAVFDAATPAVGAALELRASFMAYTASPEAIGPLEARFGLAAGDVTWTAIGGRPDCAGLAVVEASRLCDVAATDEILCADLVRRLAYGRGSYSYEPLAPIELDGFDEPVIATRVHN